MESLDALSAVQRQMLTIGKDSVIGNPPYWGEPFKMRKSRRHRPRPLLWDRRDSKLTPAQRAQKAKFLHILSLARATKTDLDEALRHLGFHPAQVLRRTRSVRMRKGKLVPKAHDRIPRSMKIYENGELVHVEVANSATASDIGRYWNAVGDLTETGKSRALRRFSRQRIKDIDGQWHRLEKDPKAILGLEERKPKPEQFEIYKR